MKTQTMLIIPFSLIAFVYRTRPDKIMSCARVSSEIHFDRCLSEKKLDRISYFWNSAVE